MEKNKMSLANFQQELRETLKKQQEFRQCLELINSGMIEIVEMCGIEPPVEEKEEKQQTFHYEGKRDVKSLCRKVLLECKTPLTKYEITEEVKKIGYMPREGTKDPSSTVYVSGIHALIDENEVTSVGGKFDRKYIAYDNPNCPIWKKRK